jgi:hypothetical protein
VELKTKKQANTTNIFFSSIALTFLEGSLSVNYYRQSFKLRVPHRAQGFGEYKINGITFSLFLFLNP